MPVVQEEAGRKPGRRRRRDPRGRRVQAPPADLFNGDRAFLELYAAQARRRESHRWSIFPDSDGTIPGPPISTPWRRPMPQRAARIRPRCDGATDQPRGARSVDRRRLEIRRPLSGLEPGRALRSSCSVLVLCGTVGEVLTSPLESARRDTAVLLVDRLVRRPGSRPGHRFRRRSPLWRRSSFKHMLDCCRVRRPSSQRPPPSGCTSATRAMRLFDPPPYCPPVSSRCSGCFRSWDQIIGGRNASEIVRFLLSGDRSRPSLSTAILSTGLWTVGRHPSAREPRCRQRDSLRRESRPFPRGVAGAAADTASGRRTMGDASGPAVSRRALSAVSGCHSGGRLVGIQRPRRDGATIWSSGCRRWGWRT